MSSLRRLSSRDLDRLSAYLDGELGKVEAEQVQARLQREPDLAEALEELRGGVRVLASLDVLRPPRSFILREEMVRARRPSTLAPALQFATVLALAAFLVVTGIDFAGRRLTLGAMAPAPAEMEQTALTTEAPPSADRAIAPTEAAMEGLVESAAAPEEPQGTAVPPPELRVGGGEPGADALTGTPEALAAEALGAGPTPTPVPAEAGTPPAEQVASAPPSAPGTEPAVSAFAAESVEAPAPSAVEPEQEVPPTGPRISAVALLQAALCLSAIVLGGLTLWVRRLRR